MHACVCVSVCLCLFVHRSVCGQDECRPQVHQSHTPLLCTICWPQYKDALERHTLAFAAFVQPTVALYFPFLDPSQTWDLLQGVTAFFVRVHVHRPVSVCVCVCVCVCV